MANDKQTNEEKQTQNNESGKPSMPGSKNPKANNNIFVVYAILLVAFIAINFMDLGSSGGTKTTDLEFYRMLKSNEVERVVIVNKEIVEVFLKTNPGAKDVSGGAKPEYTFNIGSVESFERKVDEIQSSFPDTNKISIEHQTRHNYVADVIGWILPLIILIGVWMFIMRKMGGGMGPGAQIFNIGKSRAKLFDNAEDKVKTNFNDVAGLEEAKIEIREIVDFLKNPKKYTELGGKIPKGALLVGPPGTGKTLLAKAVAGEAGVPFFSMSGSDFVEMFVGVGAARVRDLFKEAKAKAPCIVFIDEIDAIGRARGKNPNMGANDERENTLNQLLTEMDGFETDKGVIILAATNRADVLDKALMRAGRFDRQIHVELPDINEREAIFKVHLKPIKVSDEVKPEFLAKQTPGFSGADIANVCNEAALIAARKDKKSVEKQDFLDAVDRIIGGLEKRNKIITREEKRTIAFHEAGHATLSWLLEHAHPLIKVTIIPRGKALGAAWYLPEERQITTKEQIIDEICATLGGRIAEEITFGKISTGALNDLEKVTKQAYAMVTYFGMSDKIGNISFYDSTGQYEYAFSKPYSNETAILIDKEVRVIIDEAYNKAREILIKHKDGLTQLAQLLLEKEVIFSEDLEKIFGKRESFSSQEHKLIDEPNGNQQNL
ncbi:MAG TPA: ATP-dependent zinc metalloprotease FtsH [Bacteroidales bacterium]|nr:MAG: ATP-dependent zinc metalloprotease FtsH 3 [Bacteroidetes bacterium ADurb.Bin217]HPM12520.1 ATP-dependent zinc metalloprotease FtsH [Bacteroidales bacterium]